MTKHIAWNRGVVVAVYAMILVTMLAIFIAAKSFGNANTLLLLTVLLIPITAIIVSLTQIPRNIRIACYLAIALASMPIAVLGLPGGWGLLFLLGIIFLVWSAWVENEWQK